MRCTLRGTTIVSILVFAATLNASPSSIRCGERERPYEQFETNPPYDSTFVPMDAGAFRAAFRNAKKHAYGRYTFFIVRKDRGTQYVATTLMIGAAVDDQRFFRLVYRDDWPLYNEQDGDRLAKLPTISRVTNEGEQSVFRLTVNTTHHDRSYAKIEETYVVAVEPQPRIAGALRCVDVSGGSRCLDGVTKGDAVECDWSGSLRDYICTATRAYADFISTAHPWERRFTLIGSKALPVTKDKMQSFRSLEEVSVWLRTTESYPPRIFVDGVGVLAETNIPNFGVFTYVSPGVRDDMELRLFAFPHDGTPVEVALHKVVDGHELVEEREAAPDDAAYTPIGEDWSVTSRREKNLGTAEIYSIVLYDGKGRGLFWFAFDRMKMSLLRLAADVGPYRSCNSFIYPASASSITTAGDHAELLIEPHSRRNLEGELVKEDGEDDDLPCHVRGTLTWDREKGFYLLRSDVPCHDGEPRLGVVIDALGHPMAVPLQAETSRR